MANLFLSYSHNDARLVERLNVHLASMKRQVAIETWFDHDILAGEDFSDEIRNALDKADIFIAIITPDYLNSAYCYDIEMQEALKRHAQGTLTVVPVIGQPCDWTSSPFAKLKAIPQDGKPISEFTNENNAFLIIINELRRLIEGRKEKSPGQKQTVAATINRYRVKQDFDPVDLLNFRDESFKTIFEYFKSAIEEISGVDQLKARFVTEQTQQFTCVITNRAKINTSGYISIGVVLSDHFGSNGISYALAERLNQNVYGSNFEIAHSDYELYWAKHDVFQQRETEKLSAKDIAKTLWELFIEQVGVEC